MSSPPAPPAPRPTRAPAAVLRLGTRGSALALAQSRQVAAALTRAGGARVDLVTITTHGDTSREHLAQIGGTGVFVSTLRDALLDGAIDLAVHSLKDLPTATPDRLALAAVPQREDPRDALVARDGLTLQQLTDSGRPVRIGTGSPRRAAQLHAWAAHSGADLRAVPVRGNVDTRIELVRSGRLDAVVLAAAGLTRLDRLAEATHLLDTELMLPAPGQGALAIECRTADRALADALATLDHAPTRAAVTAERALLAALEAGCSAPVGALATWGPDPDAPARPPRELRLRALVGSGDGSLTLQSSATALLTRHQAQQQAAALGHELAGRLLAAGATQLSREPAPRA